jgi:Gpi18-like mannosyltransferase
VRTSLGAYIVGRAPVLIVGLWAVASFPLTTGNGPWQEWQHSVSEPWLAILSRWDSRWYYYVALDGYSYDPTAQSTVSFAPLLPALMWVGAHLVGRPNAEGYLAVGVVVANTALLALLGYLFVLTRRTWGSGAATRTLLCLLVFPTSFFLSAVYSESVFLVLAVAAFVHAEEERWWLVGLCGALAALARTYGVLIVFPLAYEYLARRGLRVRADLAWLAPVPVAFAGWLGYLWIVTGSPFATAFDETLRGKQLMPPWQTWQLFFSQPPVWGLKSNHSLTDFWFAIGFGVLVGMSWLLPRRALALYSTLMYLPMISTATLSSVSRYGLELFPVFIVLAHLTRWRVVLAVYLTVSGALALYLTARFALGYWVA